LQFTPLKFGWEFHYFETSGMIT